MREGWAAGLWEDNEGAWAVRPPLTSGLGKQHHLTTLTTSTTLTHCASFHSETYNANRFIKKKVGGLS